MGQVERSRGQVDADLRGGPASHRRPPGLAVAEAGHLLRVMARYSRRKPVPSIWKLLTGTLGGERHGQRESVQSDDSVMRLNAADGGASRRAKF
jgi:hypothetical protein